MLNLLLSSQLNHMGETEVLFRQQILIGPLFFGPKTKLFFFFKVTLKLLLHTCYRLRYFAYVFKSLGNVL